MSLNRDESLPPGQRRIEGFPRFGAHISGPPPRVPSDPVIEICGAVTEAFDLPVSELEAFPRCEITADFHCVAGWSATNLCWAGVAFETVYRTIIEPALPPGTSVTHLVFRGLDGWRSVVAIGDALAEEALIADRLDGRPLDGDHGAPARFVSPKQYGYVSTKHLCRIEVHTSQPKGVIRSPILRLLGMHPKARVWAEERHRYLPSWALRHAYRASIAFLLPRGRSS